MVGMEINITLIFIDIDTIVETAGLNNGTCRYSDTCRYSIDIFLLFSGRDDNTWLWIELGMLFTIIIFIRLVIYLLSYSFYICRVEYNA